MPEEVKPLRAPQQRMPKIADGPFSELPSCPPEWVNDGPTLARNNPVVNSPRGHALSRLATTAVAAADDNHRYRCPQKYRTSCRIAVAAAWGELPRSDRFPPRFALK
jgi:hypothetical protein